MTLIRFGQAAVLATAFAAFSPLPLLAAGGGDSVAPKPTQTTKECKTGKVWSDKKKRCVNPENSGLSDDALYHAVRELAYSGRLEEAQRVLAAMPDQSDDRVLTYWGFTHRKLGNVELGMTYYQKALAANPDNHLVRSYKGQAHVEAGDLVLARAELLQIRNRGGSGTWAEQSLRTAIKTGATYNF
jgi:tetratricopeptide (TPR) repeat protein